MGSEQPAPEADPRAAAQRLVALLPLREIFQDRELADAFLSELMLALARESSREARRELQRKGIAQAKAQGVRFGKPARPLPENFDEVRFAWRRGEFNLITAAQLCGMPKSTFSMTQDICLSTQRRVDSEIIPISECDYRDKSTKHYG